MRSKLFVVAATVASATATFVYPDIVPLHKRQAPGTPQYDCHADCGGVISVSRTENYCESANFTSGLEACLECALEFDIWRYYGDSVSTAAEGCGLEAVPVAANGTDASSTDAAATTSAAAETTTGSAETTATTTAETTAATESAATSTSESSAAASETASGTGAPAQSTNGAFKNIVSGGLAMVPIGALLAGWAY
ncbi:hypothetical protein B0A52_05133 [Exophiala mesophila]|uniref:Extracellular membrane protein CFEM domain-containing protein n=1 Tax=Exophiala mesophila TaxID=212818 RepID=A0A438N713_EXOME|nr:hypothetical protein B0A52_05133 [Exophiala mesophila]